VSVVDWPCQVETTYHCAVVEVDPERPSGRLLILDRARNSYVDLADATHLEFRYLRVMADVIDVETPPGALDVVSIGGGGFTLPRYLEATRPGTEHVVLEIDRSLVEIGRSELGLGDTVRIVIDDARRSLQDVPAGVADLVVGDAFSGLTVPWHLTTVEFVEEIAARLTTDGIYTLNLIDYSELGFARAEAATLLEVFANAAVFAPADYLTGRSGGNFVLVGSSGPIDVSGIETAIRDGGGLEIGITGADLERFVSDARPLTDDFAPVDQLISGL
jgi:spermidine synthase